MANPTTPARLHREIGACTLCVEAGYLAAASPAAVPGTLRKGADGLDGTGRLRLRGAGPAPRLHDLDYQVFPGQGHGWGRPAPEPRRSRPLPSAPRSPARADQAAASDPGRRAGPRALPSGAPIGHTGGPRLQPLRGGSIDPNAGPAAAGAAAASVWCQPMAECPREPGAARPG